MRFYFFILSLGLAVNAFSCDSRIKNYSFECEYQDKFVKLKNEFKIYNIDPLMLKGYILPYVLGYKDYNAKKNEYLNHTQENLNRNSEWAIWKKNSKAIAKLNVALLEVNDITKLQYNLLSTKPFSDLFNSNLGKLRTSNAVIYPTVTYQCDEEKINNDVISLFTDYDLKTIEGTPLLVLKNITDCKKSNEIKAGQTVYFKNASVKTELNRWVIDFNDTLLRYEMNDTIDVTPYQYLADMRRWFMAIAPFSEGNQNVAEALMQYAIARLNLPPLGQTKEATPTLLTVTENRNQTLTQMKNSLVFFEGCLYEIKTQLVSEDCQALQ
jgi:hypothetical protein